MTNFEKWEKKFKDNNLFDFNNDANGQLWLKVKAITRNPLLKNFAKSVGVELKRSNLNGQNIELFELLERRPELWPLLDKFLSDRSNEWYVNQKIDTDRLKYDLYRIHDYAWGGDQNNSLDKYFVKHYVKDCSGYDALVQKRDDIGNKAWNYVQNSWYNNWTTFLIESIFKTDPHVVSAPGEVKCVDFFIGNIPLDLKVTFFPVNYMEEKLKDLLGKSKLSWLKSKAKKEGICFDSEMPNSEIEYYITEKLRERGHTEILEVLSEARKRIVEDSINDPLPLLTNLYERQGETRFSAENRLFLILVDTSDYDQSWKLKRDIDNIEPKVKTYLENFSPDCLKEVIFNFHNQQYKALSDVIFLVR